MEEIKICEEKDESELKDEFIEKINKIEKQKSIEVEGFNSRYGVG